MSQMLRLEHLQGLTNLGSLMLFHTAVTGAGIKRLRTALPNCHITHQEWPY